MSEGTVTKVETMTKAICANCQMWDRSDKYAPGWKLGVGRCTNVPMFYEATKNMDSDDPADDGLHSVVLKPEFEATKALALDGSGYRAQLLTMPDFGCVSCVQKV